MEEEIDRHHIDGTSPMTETAVDGLPEMCLASAALEALSMSLPSAITDPESPVFSRDGVHVHVDCKSDGSALMTSTPNPVPPRPKNLPSRLPATPGTSGTHRGSRCSADSLGVGTCRSVSVEEQAAEEERLQAPIVGYEIMEQRAKFTVFKIHVRKSDEENWLLFRRYTDFVRVNDKLKQIFPVFRLALPPKRWFGSNFDLNFLEDRQLGLQAFLDNIISHKDIVLSGAVREFLCLDDPPGPQDNLEALCESLDETVYNLRMEVSERDRKIAALNAELEAAQERIRHLLHCQLPNGSNDGVNKSENAHNSSTPVSGENSTIEGDLHSQAEADQSLSFTQAEIHHNSPDEVSVNKSLSSTEDASNEPCLTPASKTDFQQGSTREEGNVRRNSQPGVITVT